MGILDPNGALMLSVLVQTSNFYLQYLENKSTMFLHCQKVHQRISMTKTNNGIFVVFKIKHELKCQFFENTSQY